ncbi:MAG TPA: hypothetical protein PLL18_15085, partial [Flavobacteriales bacterium]|nr:hypothetical protein [Flavobacteriales bacterium]
DRWDRPYSREQAAFPTHSTRERKFWPYVGRVESAWGDRNLMCSCPPMEEPRTSPYTTWRGSVLCSLLK